MGKETILLDSIKSGDLNSAEKLLNKNRKTKLINTGKKLNINYQDENGMTCLHHAAVTGNLEVVKLLIENGSKLDLKEKNGGRALHYAAYNGKNDIVSILLRCGSSCNEPTVNGDSPIHFAAQMDNPEIVCLLLNFGADVSLKNICCMSALDMACEYGRVRVVEALLKSGLCYQLLNDRSRDLLNAQSSTTCLHLAAKNNHTDIIRLLLIYGMDINRFTHQGTALHEACRYGRYQAAKLLLECGIDINHVNYKDQLASDVVIKQKVGNEIKRILKEFSECVYGISIQAYLDNHSGSLVFQKDEYITILERNPSGNWRGFILQKDFTTRFGYFPSMFVRVIDTLVNTKSLMMNNQVTNTIGCTKAALIALNAEKISRFSSIVNTIAPSIQYCSKQNQDTNNLNSHLANIDETSCDVSPIGSIDSSSKISLLSSNAADSGISSHKSLNQSPPSNSSLTFTLDANTIYDVSNQFYSKTLSSTLRSFSNTNSRTNFTMPSLNEDIYSPSSTTLSANSTSPAYFLNGNNIFDSIDIVALLKSGMKDNDILRTWLCEINLVNYYDNFYNAGYDMITLIKITPSDLIAVGICDPSTRKILLNQIKRLNGVKELDDAFLESLNKVDSIKSLLELINLEQYLKPIMQQGYLSIHDLLLINCEDFEDIGISKLGHQKKFIMTIKYLQQINNNLSEDGKLKKINPNISSSIITHAKSCENVANLKNLPNENKQCDIHTKPALPKRIDSIAKVNEDLNKLKNKQLMTCYATLPRKRNKFDKNFEYIKFEKSINKDKIVNNVNAIKMRNSVSLKNTIQNKVTEMYHNKKNEEMTQNKIKKNENFLNDIDSMLSDLNQQLDAMLEYEKSSKTTHFSNYDKGNYRNHV